jgi:sulfur dioxygenase
MYFRLLHDEASGMVSYLLADLDGGEAVLVDPRAGDLPVLEAMLDEQRLSLRWVLRTHEHDQLLPGEAEAIAALGAPVVVHRLPVADGGVLVFGHEHLRALATPGHTAGCLSYLWRDRLFCGGVLAVDGCPFQPRPALPEALWDSVTRGIFALPDETLLFSGHAQQARAVCTLHEARRAHAWFAHASRDEFLARVRALPAGDPRRRGKP